eukprot:65434-Chlamydomonas_euryale.AAC.2
MMLHQTFRCARHGTAHCRPFTPHTLTPHTLTPHARRDIKLENILRTEDGVLKLADFGLAIDLNEERAVTRAGTLDYMVRMRCVKKGEAAGLTLWGRWEKGMLAASAP